MRSNPASLRGEPEKATPEKGGLGNRRSIHLSYGAERQKQTATTQKRTTATQRAHNQIDCAKPSYSEGGKDVTARAFRSRAKKSLAVRFAAKVDTSGGPDACHRWLGRISPDGYGRLDVNVKQGYGAHRLAWELANGKPFPAGKVGMHSCDNRWCANARHITPGTIAENNRDMFAKGRGRPPIHRPRVERSFLPAAAR